MKPVNRTSKKPFKIFLLFVLFSSAIMLIFRKKVGIALLHILLSLSAKVSHAEIDYKIISDEVRGVAIENLAIANDRFSLYCPQAFIDVKVDFSKFKVTPSLNMENIDLVIDPTSKSTSQMNIPLPLLKFVFNKVCLKAENGTLLFNHKEDQKYLFNLEVNGGEEEKLSFSLSQENEKENASLFDLCVFSEEKHFVVDAEAHAAPLAEVTRLLSMFPIDGIEKFAANDGVFNLKARLSFTPIFDLEHFFFETQAQNLAIELQNASTKAKIKNLAGTLSWGSQELEKVRDSFFNEKLSVKCHLDDAEISDKDFSLINALSGDFAIEGNKIQSFFKADLAKARSATFAGAGEIYGFDAFFFQNSCLFGKKEEPLLITYTKTSADESVIQIDTAKVALEDVKEPLMHLFPKLVLSTGEFKGQVLAKYHNYHLVDVQFNDCKLSQFSVKGNGKEAIADRLDFAAYITYKNGECILENAEAKLSGGNIWDPKSSSLLLIENLQGSLVVKDEKITHCQMTSLIFENRANVQAELLENSSITKVNFNLPLAAIALIDPKFQMPKEQVLKGSVEIKPAAAMYEVKGDLAIDQNTFSLKAQIPKDSRASIESLVAEVKTEHCDLSLFQPILTDFFIDCLVEGDIGFKIGMKNAVIDAAIVPRAYTFTHPYLKISQAAIAEPSNWNISYNLKNHSLSGKGQIKDAVLSQIDEGLPIEHIDVNWTIDNERLVANQININGSWLKFKGFAELGISDDPLILMKSSFIKADIEQLVMLIKNFNVKSEYIKPITGEIFAKGGDNHLVMQKEKGAWIADYALKAEVKVESLKLSEQVSINAAKGQVFLSKEDNIYSLSHFVGELSYSDYRLFNVFIEDISLKSIEDVSNINLDFACFKGNHELAKASIKLEKKPAGSYELKHPPLFHVLGKKLSIEAFVLNEELKLQGLVIQSSHKLVELLPVFELLPTNGYEELKKLSISSPKSLVNWVVSYSKPAERFQLVANVDEITTDYQKICNLVVDARYEKKAWIVEAEDESGLKVDLRMLQKAEVLHIENLDLKTQTFNMSASGIWNQKESTLHLNVNNAYLSEDFLRRYVNAAISGSLLVKGQISKKKETVSGYAKLEGKLKAPAEVTIYTETNVPFTYEKTLGLIIPDCSLHYIQKDGKKSVLSLKEVRYTQEDFEVEECVHNFSHQDLQLLSKLGLIPDCLDSLLEENHLCGSLSLKKKGQEYVVKGAVSSVKSTLLNASLPLTKLRYEVDSNNFCLASFVQYHDAKVLIEMRVDFRQNKAGIITLKSSNQNEGIKAYFQGFTSDVPNFKTIQGSLFGLKVDLKKVKNNTFDGKVSLDPMKSFVLFNKSQQERIKKLEVSGDLAFTGKFDLFGKDNGFQGFLSGENFTLFGKIFETLKGSIVFKRSEIQVVDLKVNDVAGEFNVKRANIFLNDKSRLSCPIVQINRFRPSALRTLKNKEPEIKPLVVQRVTIRDLKGYLEALETLQGTGELYFNNFVKKEIDFFDIPRNFIKNLGLDTSILTPVNGEVEFYIKEKKCFLTSLTNTKSEEGRSEFFLTSDINSNYVDFEGNINIDVFIKQNVMLKIAEPFTFSIRGTLKKPKYFVQ